jgi:hypothetical protein
MSRGHLTVFTRTWRLVMSAVFLAATCGCQTPGGRSDVPTARPAQNPPAATSSSPPPRGASDTPSATKCVPSSALPAPPRKVRDRKADLSDLRDVRTHGGELVFDVTIAASGNVADVRLMKDGDTRPPWPTIADRWRSAIADWRYEPTTVNDQPVAVCMTVQVSVHVR